MPRGPIVERTVSARTLAAMMLLLWASLPLEREVPSFKMKIGISDVLESHSEWGKGLEAPEINICSVTPNATLPGV
jgi:hypothetical protein